MPSTKVGKKDLGSESEKAFSASAPTLLLFFVIHSLGLHSFVFANMLDRDTVFKMKKTFYKN